MTQWYLNHTHLLLQRHQTLHKDLTFFFPPKKKQIDPEVRRNIHDFRRSDPKICSFNKFLSKKRYGYQEGMWRCVFRCFFFRQKKATPPPDPRCDLGDVFCFFFEHSQRLFFGGPWFLGKKQFFFFNLKHEGKLEDDYLGEWNLLKILLKISGEWK